MTLLLSVVGLIILLTPTLVYGQSASPSVIPQHVEERIQIHKQKLQENLEQNKELHKQNVETKHQQFQDKLKQVKNKHHAQVAEKIHQNLNNVNETVTTSWLKSLGHMSEVLIKLDDHLNKAAGEGKDITQAQAAVNNAKTKVTEAESALKTQAEKIYTITVSDPRQVGPDVKASRDILHTDLKSVHQALLNAKEAVVEASRAVGHIRGGTNGQ